MDRYVVQCNYSESTRSVSSGSRAYLILANPGSGDDRIIVLARSRSGRWIRKWENIRRLGNFRVKTLPEGHPLYRDGRIWDRDAGRMSARLTRARERVNGAGD